MIKEKCTLCGKKVNISTDTSIYWNNYVVGGGQLCPKCYKKVYGNEMTEVIRSKKGDMIIRQYYIH